MTTTFKCRRTLGFLVLAAAAATVAAAWIPRRDGVAPDVGSAGAAAVVSCEMNGFRYEFHAATGRECLFDATRDPRGLSNVLHDRADVAAACRRELERKLGVTSLDSLRAPYEAAFRRLHAMGYL